MPLPVPRWALPLQKRILDQGVFGHSDYTPFVILGRSRVGSNLLRSLLNAHPCVMTFGEIFKNVNNPDWDHKGYFQSRSMLSLLRRDPAAFLDTKVFGRYPGSTRAVGFKIFYYHARVAEQSIVWDYLQDRQDLRVIHLKRLNVLQTHLSRKRAAMTNRWVNASGAPDESVPPLVLDYDECLQDFVQTRQWEGEHDRAFAGHPQLEVQYDRLVTDSGQEAYAIQRFLGVDARLVEPATFPQTRQPLSAAIANYADLKARFLGSSWEQFFIE